VTPVNEILAYLRLQQHPDKTFIGRVSHGFDFLGHACSAQGLTLAEPTIGWYAEHLPLLDEQEAGAIPRWGLRAPVAGVDRSGLVRDYGWDSADDVHVRRDVSPKEYKG
jgi:hypothetical protein